MSKLREKLANMKNYKVLQDLTVMDNNDQEVTIPAGTILKAEPGINAHDIGMLYTSYNGHELDLDLDEEYIQES